jgi:hypothetical protein
MAKGLSELQKNILKIAYKNRDSFYKFGHVRNCEVLIRFYNFPFHSPAAGSSGTPQIFDRKEIGCSRYNAACVATVKSFDRLVKRGFAERKKTHSIILTEEGAKVAKIIDRETKNDRTN